MLIKLRNGSVSYLVKEVTIMACKGKGSKKGGKKGKGK